MEQEKVGLGHLDAETLAEIVAQSESTEGVVMRSQSIDVRCRNKLIEVARRRESLPMDNWPRISE